MAPLAEAPALEPVVAGPAPARAARVAPAAPESEVAAKAYAASLTGRERNGLPTAQNRHGSSTALVIPIRLSADT